MTRSLVIVAVGAALIVAGFAWWLGPLVLMVSGVVLVGAGLLVDEEALRGQPDKPPGR